MIKITLNVEGMKCPKCEAHMNEAVKAAFKVKEVVSSHEKNETVIICKNDIAEESLREITAQAGYELKGVEKETYEEKKGFFSLFKK